MEIHSLEQLLSGNYTQVSRIKISAALRTFPSELFEYTETLKILDLSDNLLTEIPEAILRFKKLKILFLSNNRFSQFPLVLGRSTTLSMIGFKSNQIDTIPEGAFPETLRWLILTNNCIEQLPSSIGKCTLLQKVALAGNRLSRLPEEMANCKNLGLLRISANAIQELPSWLLTLPHLAWLAYSGNPCAAKLPVTEALPVLNWTELSIMEKLGEGASGIISKAVLTKTRPGSISQEVAVKVFKGEVTSAGYPQDEMAVSAGIPKHINLVKVLGKIAAHPDNKEGLIFELIPASYRNLGMPPSFVSCTRDTFSEGTVFSLKHILKIVSAIADAAMHLHTAGIMHGDLYAHNTLIDDEANALFGDFGAATAYSLKSVNAPLLQAIEVKSFGFLMDDLLIHAEQAIHTTILKDHLEKLKDECLQEDVFKRPDFADICKQLSNF